MENTFGTYLKSLRQRKGTSINELVKLSGVSKGYISQIENNKFIPSLDIVRKLSNALGVDFYKLSQKAGLFLDNELLPAEISKIQFGKYLRNSRESKDISTSKLSKLTGISRTYLSQLETSSKKPSEKILRKLSDVLDEDFSLLMGMNGYLVDGMTEITNLLIEKEQILRGENEKLRMENNKLKSELEKIRSIINAVFKEE